MKHMQYASRLSQRPPCILGRVTVVRAMWVILMVTWLAILPGNSAQAQETSVKPAAVSEPLATDGPTEVRQPKTTATGTPETSPVPSGILLNFRDTSLQAVLEYLSEAAVLVILNDARVDGRVTVMSRQPVSTDEAIRLLDTILKDKGYAAAGKINSHLRVLVSSYETAIERQKVVLRKGMDDEEIAYLLNSL